VLAALCCCCAAEVNLLLLQLLRLLQLLTRSYFNTACIAALQGQAGASSAFDTPQFRISADHMAGPPEL
jgi:hypothetical protein